MAARRRLPATSSISANGTEQINVGDFGRPFFPGDVPPIVAIFSAQLALASEIELSTAT
jgi:hypothetical protein